MAQFTFRVRLYRRGNAEPIDGGLVTVTGQDYETFKDAQALTAILPGGIANEHIEMDSSPGYVRWRGIMFPATEFERVEVQIVAAAKEG